MRYEMKSMIENDLDINELKFLYKTLMKIPRIDISANDLAVVMSTWEDRHIQASMELSKEFNNEELNSLLKAANSLIGEDTKFSFEGISPKKPFDTEEILYRAHVKKLVKESIEINKRVK